MMEVVLHNPQKAPRNLIRTLHHNLAAAVVVDILVLAAERTSWLAVRKGLQLVWVRAVRRHWGLVWQLAFPKVGNRLPAGFEKRFFELLSVGRLWVLVLLLMQVLLGFLQLLQPDIEQAGDQDISQQ
jgi:hypothetical protein